MTHSFKLSRRIARLRAPIAAALILALAACDSADPLNPDSSTNPDPVDQGPVIGDDGALTPPPADAPVPSLATSFAGGIPMGIFALPNSWFGSRYNGAMRTIGPYNLLSDLSTIRSRNGKIVLMMAGSQKYYLNSDGTFSLSRWKARVDRFRKINFSQYIKDGTIIAHYLIDEPYDPANFGGKPVPNSTLDEMARYSKSIWPDLKTVVRAEPYYIKYNYRYLDAAWAQYLWRKGDVGDYIAKNVSVAKSLGLGLVVGLNIMHGGNPKGTKMTPTEIQNWGSTLLSSDYPCAFISWTYNSDYLSTSGVESAMDALRRKSENRASRSCES